MICEEEGGCESSQLTEQQKSESVGGDCRQRVGERRDGHATTRDDVRPAAAVTVAENAKGRGRQRLGCLAGPYETTELNGRPAELELDALEACRKDGLVRLFERRGKEHDCSREHRTAEAAAKHLLSAARWPPRVTPRPGPASRPANWLLPARSKFGCSASGVSYLSLSLALRVEGVSCRSAFNRRRPSTLQGKT